MPLASIGGAALSAGRAIFSSGAASTAAGGALTAKEVVAYNRENFMEDREQRMKKEFQERKMRVKQGQLWREDVRAVVSLTERKMKYYLLVNVLLLGFNVNLWCEGRLPENAPGWLMMGNQISAAGSFYFFLLTVWLAMQAAVAAQSYEARILTQMVRLPIPTWQELEACRTYGSEFERLEPRQMFRVPFVGGRQERIVERSSTLAEPPSSDQAGVSQGNPSESLGRSSVSTDPWGLERRGDEIYELGTQYGKDVADLRHIKIIRQAAVYWQTYDAFARVSMFVGMNQLILAMIYYVMGYLICQVHCPTAALAGTIVLIAMCEIIAQVDITLSTMQWRMIQLLLISGPLITFVGTYNAALGSDISLRVAQCLAPCAFLAHGAILALVTVFLRVKEQPNGAQLPLAFQGVLYLDVFGWIHEMPADARTAALVAESRAAKRDESTPKSAQDRSSDGREELGSYAQSYLTQSRGDNSTSESEAPVSPTSERISLATCARPTETLYDENGKPMPTRPDDARPSGAVDDMRYVAGAPRMWETVSAINPPAKKFFEAVTFMPAEDRRRQKIDSMLGDSNAKRSAEEIAIVTGHDNESPGLLPWTVFSCSALLLCLIWLLAAIIAISETGRGPASLSWLRNDFSEDYIVEAGADVVPMPSVLTLWRAGIFGSSIGPELEAVDVRWPYSRIEPKGLSCDSSGRTLLVTDGVSTYSAGLVDSAADAVREQQLFQFDSSSVPAERHRRLRATVRGAASLLAPGSGSVQSRPSAEFREAPCAALGGEAVVDTAVFCDRRNGAETSDACSALLLHRHGQRLSVCDIRGVSHEDSARSYELPHSWLEKGASAAADHRDAEEVSGILTTAGAGSACNSTGEESSERAAYTALRNGCASATTSSGRIVRLTQGAERKALVPAEEALAEAAAASRVGDGETTSELPLQNVPGAARAFNSRFVGVLQPLRRSIHVVDLEVGGAKVGHIYLPPEPANGFQSFCAGAMLAGSSATVPLPTAA
eukprot:TRINITY_DN14252_c0_g1_i3.p1 TRINITY_DN14252_c0_g1~~TRINITY_DN14252_c0_g1_i3.p1  ORF type:complete len:1003 (-),score=113.93 TRINITY_DN14252_c0_g1_i3:773-3781(-)